MLILHRISTRLTLTLLGVSLGSLLTFSWLLNRSLENFFIQDAQMYLLRQADSLANQINLSGGDSPKRETLRDGAKHPPYGDRTLLHQLTELTAQQGRIQVVLLDNAGIVQLQKLGVAASQTVEIPPLVIVNTRSGTPQQGRFRVKTDTQYPWWIYSTAPVRQTTTNQVIGIVYVAMPMRRPRLFAQQVTGVVMVMAIFATSVAAIAGLLLSRSVTRPLKRLHHQAERLKIGDYTARSRLQGQDELVQLGQLLDEMATKLVTTMEALTAQEISRRELVANVSHDLRTPLATLRVELEAILDGVVSGEKANQYLRRACRETDYLAHLVEQLLLLSKADAGQLPIKPQAVSAVAIAQECISRMELTAAQSQLKLELSSVQSLPAVWVDPELTGQVVLNLLDNAIKYAPESGVIRLELLPEVEQNQQRYVPLQIRDRGQGMQPEELQRITERFYRGNQARPRGGFGLGLAIAQQICQLQGGYLQINSQPQQGTVVQLLLPTCHN
ncbi:ATP-binding protein [Pelatocladus sp. BLCC-F211]|uniref:sensor histidine kinase n=1 Tax=Pelatocladus sp. BLCC-F211 TaxID=3342752 RepID=UPI0035BA5975